MQHLRVVVGMKPPVVLKVLKRQVGEHDGMKPPVVLKVVKLQVEALHHTVVLKLLVQLQVQECGKLLQVMLHPGLQHQAV